LEFAYVAGRPDGFGARAAWSLMMIVKQLEALKQIFTDSAYSPNSRHLYDLMSPFLISMMNSPKYVASTHSIEELLLTWIPPE
jgi:hypothetical protein